MNFILEFGRFYESQGAQLDSMYHIHVHYVHLLAEHKDVIFSE